MEFSFKVSRRSLVLVAPLLGTVSIWKGSGVVGTLAGFGWRPRKAAFTYCWESLSSRPRKIPTFDCECCE